MTATAADISSTDNTAADSSITIEATDQLIINDAGVMKQTAMSDVKSFIGTTLNTISVDIGDWNMDASQTLSVAHGLTASKIRSVSCIIRDDLASNYYVIPQGDSVATPATGEGLITYGSTNVTLWILTGGRFDNASFNSTGYNRGWLTFLYTD